MPYSSERSKYSSRRTKTTRTFPSPAPLARGFSQIVAVTCFCPSGTVNDMPVGFADAVSQEQRWYGTRQVTSWPSAARCRDNPATASAKPPVFEYGANSLVTITIFMRMLFPKPRQPSCTHVQHIARSIPQNENELRTLPNRALFQDF